MTYLSRPRIYFGGTWTVNVATANNHPFAFTGGGPNDKVALFDFGNCAALENVVIDGQPVTDSQLRQYLNLEMQQCLGVAQDWNYHGSNTATFDTSVVGVDLGSGFSAADALVGEPARFQNYALCDNNPVGSQTTQVFSDAFQLGDLVGVPDKGNSRWVWFGRNMGLSGVYGASGVFMTRIPMSDPQWAQLAAMSDAGKALAAAARSSGATHLSVRYCQYLTNFDEVNGPYGLKTGRVTGVIGLLGAGQPYTFPAARRLMGRQVLAEAGWNKDNNVTVTPGPAWVQADPVTRHVVVDLVTSTIELDALGRKLNLGTITVTLSQGPKKVALGQIPYSAYNREGYERSSGIVDLDYGANPQAAEIDALLASDAATLSLEVEAGTMAQEVAQIETDDRNVYLERYIDPVEKTPGTTAITLVATSNGAPLANTTLHLAQLNVTNNDEWLSTVAPVAGDVVSLPAKVVTGADGTAAITLTAAQAGNALVAFSLQPFPPKWMLDQMNTGFCNVRVLPSEDFSGITDAQLTGQAGAEMIYRKVLRYYYLAFPIMQPIVDFSNWMMMLNPTVAQSVLAYTDPAKWGSYRYMPRNRDLSEARRALMVRFMQVNKLLPAT